MGLPGTAPRKIIDVPARANCRPLSSPAPVGASKLKIAFPPPWSVACVDCWGANVKSAPLMAVLSLAWSSFGAAVPLDHCSSAGVIAIGVAPLICERRWGSDRCR